MNRGNHGKGAKGSRVKETPLCLKKTGMCANTEMVSSVERCRRKIKVKKSREGC